MVIGIIGIVVALIVFLWGAYKNVSVLYLAPIAGIIVAAIVFRVLWIILKAIIGGGVEKVKAALPLA